MIIYKDIISGDEMFCDIFPIKEVGIMYEVTGKMKTETTDTANVNIGANASAEEVEEQSETSASQSGVDIILNHKLQTTMFTLKSYQGYIKDYMKALKKKAEENGKTLDQKALQEKVKEIFKGFKRGPNDPKDDKSKSDYEFYTGEGQDPDGMCALLEWRENETVPVMLFFKDGIEAEKV